MNEQLRRYVMALLALGLPLTYGLAAAAQEIVEERYERYVVEEPASAAEIDDDADEVLIADRDGMQRCAESFRSFDPATGTYVTYAGETRPCPYLE
jgi:hypothetical protein